MYRLDENSKYSKSISTGTWEWGDEGVLMIFSKKSDLHIFQIT